MGEIGFDRKEFLNELKFWEVQSIMRGYNARHHAGWEQARFIAYHARYCMGVPKGQTAPKVEQWWPLPWEHDIAPITQEEEDEIKNDLEEILREDQLRQQQQNQ